MTTIIPQFWEYSRILLFPLEKKSDTWSEHMVLPKEEVRLEGRIEMHLSGGYTKVRIFIGGSDTIDVQTQDIPSHLRSLGSKVLVTFKQGCRLANLGNDEAYNFEEIVITDFPDKAELGWTRKEDSQK
jgi:hypothetical protein